MNLKRHDALLRQWRKRPRHATEGFVSDGPMDPNRWKKIERRVLFLAKEAYDKDNGPGWDLPELVREEWNGPRGNFLWTLGYWAYGIQRLTGGPIPSSPWTCQLWEEVKESLLASAVVNIKKSGGRSTSNDDDLRKYVSEDGNLLEQQVRCLDPHVVVCCKTWPLVNQEVWPQAEHISERVYRKNGMLMLDFWHPSYRCPKVMKYYTVAVLLHQALFPR